MDRAIIASPVGKTEVVEKPPAPNWRQLSYLVYLLCRVLGWSETEIPRTKAEVSMVIDMLKPLVAAQDEEAGGEATGESSNTSDDDEKPDSESESGEGDS